MPVIESGTLCLLHIPVLATAGMCRHDACMTRDEQFGHCQHIHARHLKITLSHMHTGLVVDGQDKISTQQELGLFQCYHRYRG